MGVKGILDHGLTQLFSASPRQVLIRLGSWSFNAGSYDDEFVNTALGSIYTSGLLFPMHNKMGSEEAMLREQGKLLTKDKILYIAGSYDFTGATLFSFGSPTVTESYTLIPDGIRTYFVDGSIAYSKIWLRYSLNNGFFGGSGTWSAAAGSVN